jgi:hypothetical protein
MANSTGRPTAGGTTDRAEEEEEEQDRMSVVHYHATESHRLNLLFELVNGDVVVDGIPSESGNPSVISR